MNSSGKQSFIGWLSFLRGVQKAKVNGGSYYDKVTNTYYYSIKLIPNE